MRALGITVLAAAALSAAPLAGATAASASATHQITATHRIMPAWFAARDEGFGATLAAAESNAKLMIEGDYGPCKAPYSFYSTGQSASGSWYAWVSAECSEYH